MAGNKLRKFILALCFLFPSVVSAQSFTFSLNSDSFTRANSGNLGGNWTAESGAISGSPMSIVSNAATPSSGTNNSASFWSANSFTANQWAECIVNGTSNSSGVAGVVLRASGGDNYYRVVMQPGTSGSNGAFTVAKVVSGVFTDIGGGANALTIATGSLMHAEISGTTITVYINGTLVKTITDSSLASGSPGIAAFIGTHPVNITNWRGGDLVWTRQGTVIPFNFAGSSGAGNQEPTILYTTTDCIIVSNPCFQMYFTDGWTTVNISYVESADGITWSNYVSNHVMSGGAVAHGLET
jgi:hypothetical protein